MAQQLESIESNNRHATPTDRGHRRLVAVGAEITGYDDHDFRLEPPGPWFDSFQDTWLPLPPRRRWILWGAPSTVTQPPENLERRASQAAYRTSRDRPADDVPVRSNGRL